MLQVPNFLLTPLFKCASVMNWDRHLDRLLNLVSVNTKYGALAVTTTPILICLGIYLTWAHVERAWKGKKEIRRMYSRSLSMAALHGGKLAMERLIDYHHARADAASLDAAEAQLKALLRDEHPDFNKLQSTVAKLEMSGKEEAAVQILEGELKEACDKGKPVEAYEIGMLLVEMYIYKGDFKKALDCDCLTHEKITDARRPLYKAIIHIMLEHHVAEALKCWQEFKDIRSYLPFPPDCDPDSQLLHRALTSFDEFEKVVKLLKNDIQSAHATKTRK